MNQLALVSLVEVVDVNFKKKEAKQTQTKSTVQTYYEIIEM